MNTIKGRDRESTFIPHHNFLLFQFFKSHNREQPSSNHRLSSILFLVSSLEVLDRF